MDIREDTWFSNIFGYPVFKIETGPVALKPDETFPALSESIKLHASQQTAAFYYAKADTTQIGVVRELGQAGLYVVDVNVTFSRDAKATLPPAELSETSELSLHEIEPAEHEQTLDIAGSCFRYSRFHLDPLVPPSIAHQIKRDWILNYVRRQRGERLVVATMDGRPVGFVAVIRAEREGRRICIIDLIGVSAEFQRRRVGHALTAYFISHYREQCDALEVGTQAANIPSMRLYQKLGFYLSQTQYVMHGHVGSSDLAVRRDS